MSKIILAVNATGARNKLAILAIPLEHRPRQMPYDFASLESYKNDICRFRAMALLHLHLVVNWPVFSIYDA